MSMNFKTYIITGFKTTREEMYEKWTDAFEDICGREPDGIVFVASEDSEAVVVGMINHKLDEYQDTTGPEELKLLSHTMVDEALRSVGINVGVGRISNYVYGTWG